VPHLKSPQESDQPVTRLATECRASERFCRAEAERAFMAKTAKGDAREVDLKRDTLVLKGSGSAANALIDEAASLHLLRAVNIAEVDNDRSRHFPL
jgi:hypothetical protein